MRPEPPAQFRSTAIERLGLQRFLSPVGRIILRNLERKPIQAIFSILGIALAVAILVVGFFLPMPCNTRSTCNSASFSGMISP